MTRQTLDILIGIAGLSVLGTGLLIAYILPAYSRSAAIWGWTRHDWGGLHLYLALGLVGLILVHLVLHWSWVCVVGAKVLARLHVQATAQLQWAVAVAAALLLSLALGGFLYVAASAKVEPTDERPRRGRQAAWVIPQSASPAAPVTASSGSASSTDTPGPSAS